MTNFTDLRDELNALPAGNEEEKIAKSKAIGKARLSARDALIAFGLENGDENIKAAAMILRPKAGGGGGGSRVSKVTIVSGIFDDLDEINEDDLFLKYKLGRIEMKGAITEGLKRAEADDRKWISFDPETGIYKLEAVGAEAPEGWTGYRPVDIDEID